MKDTLKQLLDTALKIGVSPTDNEAVTSKKIAITMVPLFMGPIGTVWGLVLFSLGHYLSASIPILYAFLSLLNLWHFYKTKDFHVIKTMQMYIILVLPFLLMWTLGGFANGSFVFIWAFFAPIAAIFHDKSRKSLYWMYSFIVLVAFSTLINTALMEMRTEHLPRLAVEIFFFFNIALSLLGIFLLIRYFINEKDKSASHKLQLKHEALLEKTQELYHNISFLESYKKSIDENLIVSRTDINGVITYANQNFYNTSGFCEKEVIGHKHSIIKHPHNSKALFASLWKTILKKKTWHGRLKNRKKDGSIYWIDTSVSPILNNDGEIVEFIAIRQDITQLIQHQAKLTQMLYIDSLTSLKNRNALLQDILTTESLSCSLINIDNFSHINNLYGENIGNRVLVEFSDFLSESIADNHNAKLYRLGGDEFVILSKKTSKERLGIEITELLKKTYSKQLQIDDHEISLSVTVGQSTEANFNLLSTANMALTTAKRDSKHLLMFTKELSLNSEYQDNIKWIKEIKSAIKEDRITIFYQPIVNNADNADNTVNKYETLIRLISKDGEVITPSYFLEIAKKAKLYKQLTKIVIKKAFEAFKDNDYEFSINLTIDDILDKNISQYIIQTLKEYDISHRVVFEIVESESINNFDDIEEFILLVKSFGCRIAIDDFGTGYSNFEHLMRLQADFIKIDGSIIKEIVNNKQSALITSVIVAFAKEMNIQTIGEYVETEVVHEKLKSLGVNKSQGYYFGSPQATLGKKEI